MQRNQKFTTTITIPMQDYERLIKAEAHLQAIINAPNYQRQAVVDAIVETMWKAGQAEAGADL